MRAGNSRKKNGRPVRSRKKKWYTPIALLFHSFLTSLNLGLAGVFLVSAYSDRVSPETNVLFAYLGLAFPFLAIANICFMAYWVFTRKWLMTFIMAIVFTICWQPLFRYCPVHFKTQILPRENTIKVLSYNVMRFADRKHTPQSPNRIIRYIAESGADIVCLQEYRVGSRAGLMTSQEIAKALPMYPYIAEVFLSSSPDRQMKEGLALLSKYPVTHSRRIQYPSHYNGSSIHTVNVNGKSVVVVNNHLESFKLTTKDRSQYSDMITHVSLESFDKLRGSIRQKLGQAFRIRARQAETIAREVRKANGYYTVICGDFNDTPVSYARRVVQGSFVDAFMESGSGMGISYNQNLFFFRIDHIIHSPSMTSYNCRVDTRVRLSDHYPIDCLLQLE